MGCIADDITECECEDCTAEQLTWEHLQGWHDLPEPGCPGCAAEREEGCP